MSDLFIQTKLNKPQEAWQGPFVYSTEETKPTALVFSQQVPTAKPGNSVFTTPTIKKILKESDDAKKGDGLSTKVNGWYVLNGTEARKAQVTDELAVIKDSKKQEARFEELKNATVSKNDASIVAGNLGTLNSDIQIKEMKSLLNNQNLSEDVKIHSDKEVARNAHKFAKENQTAAVKILQQTPFAQAVQKEIDKIIVNQYAKFAKENQLDIHQIMSNSKDNETVKYAALNIYQLDKSNQAGAVKITVATNDEAAIKAASSQWNKYDDSAKSEIKATIENSKYESARNALKLEELKKSQEEASSKSTTEDIIKEVKEKINKNDTANLEKTIKTMSKGDQLELLREFPGNTTIMKIMFQNNPSVQVVSEINNIMKKENKLLDNKTLLPQLCFLSTSIQESILKESAINHELGSINRSFLANSVKRDFDELTKKQEYKA